MGTSSIPVDVFNPGQVFGCLGLLEASVVLCGRARAGFDWRDPYAVRFVVETSSDRPPVEVVMEFLAGATVASRAPFESANSTAKWDIPTTMLRRDEPYPFGDQPSPATLPAVLVGPNERGERVEITIDHWGDKSRGDSIKFWGGAAGYPGARLAYDALELVRDRLGDATGDPFSIAAPQKSSFRLDWRRDYIPMDAGFSLNNHGDRFSTIGYPIVELLGAIGLTYARPNKKPKTKLEYEYGIVGTDASRRSFEVMEPILLRTALGSDELPFHRRRFRMSLGWAGKENQSRTITTVTEETNR